MVDPIKMLLSIGKDGKSFTLKIDSTELLTTLQIAQLMTHAVAVHCARCNIPVEDLENEPPLKVEALA